MKASQKSPYKTPILKQLSMSGNTFPFLSHLSIPRGRLADYNTLETNSARKMMVKQMVASPGDSG